MISAIQPRSREIVMHIPKLPRIFEPDLPEVSRYIYDHMRPVVGIVEL